MQLKPIYIKLCIYNYTRRVWGFAAAAAAAAAAAGSTVRSCWELNHDSSGPCNHYAS